MQLEQWRQDFPLDWRDDDYVTRRQFIAFLTLISGGLFLGTLLVGSREWRHRRTTRRPEPVRIAGVGDLPVGGARLFSYPTPDDRCLLIRLGPERFVAYNQACTHLACPVTYETGSDRLRCPCHEGYFAVEDGRPLAGPPKLPLSQIAIEIHEGGVWATGVIRA